MSIRTLSMTGAAAALLLAAGAAAAHGTHHVILDTPPHAVAIEFLYTGPSPMRFASVEVFAPGGDRPYQTGRTDRAGRFAFVPGEPGTWRLEADDGEGHRHRVTVDVDSSQAVPPRAVRRRSVAP